MAKIRTLSRHFMAGHPKHGYPTHFVEKFLNSLEIDYRTQEYLARLTDLNTVKITAGKLSIAQLTDFFHSLDASITECKGHTIRAGHHFKHGDHISIRTWANQPGKRPRPYFDSQIILTPDIPIANLWSIKSPHVKSIAPTLSDFSITALSYKHAAKLGMRIVPYKQIDKHTLAEIAKNDALSIDDFYAWFTKPFIGQIICWDPAIQY